MHFTLVAYFQLHFRQFYHESILYGPWLDCFHQQTELGPYWVTLSGGIRDIAWRQILKWNNQQMITNIYHLEIADTLQGDRTIIVPSPWGYHMMTVRCPYDFMGSSGASATLRAPYDYRKSLRSFLGQNDNLKPCVVLTITLRCPYGDRTMSLWCVYGLRAYDFFQICHCAELNKIVEATVPVNPYDDGKVSLRRPHGNGDLDIVRALYTRRKANVTEA